MSEMNNGIHNMFRKSTNESGHELGPNEENSPIPINEAVSPPADIYDEARTDE